MGEKCWFGFVSDYFLMVHSWFSLGKIKLHHFLFLALTSIVSGSIWYLWTFWQAGIVIPNTAWTDQAQHTVSSFFVFIFQWKNYSIVGWLILFGIAIGIKELFSSGLKKPENFILLVWFVPFWLVWWWFVSYDSRFILLILPLACVLGACSIKYICGFIEIRFRNFFLLLYSYVQPFGHFMEYL